MSKHVRGRQDAETEIAPGANSTPTTYRLLGYRLGDWLINLISYEAIRLFGPRSGLGAGPLSAMRHEPRSDFHEP